MTRVEFAQQRGDHRRGLKEEGYLGRFGESDSGGWARLRVCKTVSQRWARPLALTKKKKKKQREATSVIFFKRIWEYLHWHFFLLQKMDASLHKYVSLIIKTSFFPWVLSLKFKTPMVSQGSTIYFCLNTRISNIRALDSLGMKNNSESVLLIEIHLLKSYGP